MKPRPSKQSVLLAERMRSSSIWSYLPAIVVNYNCAMNIFLAEIKDLMVGRQICQPVPKIFECWHIFIFFSCLRRSRGGNNVACQTNLAFAEKEHGFVLAHFGFACRQQRAVVHIRRVGFAGEQGKSRVAVSHAVNVDAFGIHFVESDFHHATKVCGGIQSWFLLGHVHGIFRAFNAKLVADGDGVGGAFLDALREGAGVLLAVADGNVQGGMRGFAGVVGSGV